HHPTRRMASGRRRLLASIESWSVWRRVRYRGNCGDRFLLQRWSVRHDDPGYQISQEAPADKQGSKQPDQPDHRGIKVQVLRKSRADTCDLAIGLQADQVFMSQPRG